VQAGIAATIRQAELAGRGVAYTSKSQPNYRAKRHKWQATGKDSCRSRHILAKYANQYLNQPNFFVTVIGLFFIRYVSFLFTVFYIIVFNRYFLAANLQNKIHLFIYIYYYFTCIYNCGFRVFVNCCAKLTFFFFINYYQQIIYLTGLFCVGFAYLAKIK